MFIEVHKCKEKLCASAKRLSYPSKHFIQFLQPLQNYGIFHGVKLAFSSSF